MSLADKVELAWPVLVLVACHFLSRSRWASWEDSLWEDPPREEDAS